MGHASRDDRRVTDRIEHSEGELPMGHTQRREPTADVHVYRIMYDGTRVKMATFERYDCAVRYAQDCARSYARNDARKAWVGKPTSGIQAIECLYDVWNVPELACGLKGVHAVRETTTREDHDAEALAVAFHNAGYDRSGTRI